MSLLLVLTPGCKKDPFIDIPHQAEADSGEQLKHCDFDLDGIVTSPQYKYEFPYLSAPVVNPGNSDEIVFIRSNSLTNHDLCIHNWRTGFTTTIVQGVVHNANPAWSVTGYILFSMNGTELWKIKSDGSDLAIFSPQPGVNYSPCWNSTGSKVTFHNFSDEGTKVFTSTANGILLDSLDIIHGRRLFDWASDERYLFTGYAQGSDSRFVIGLIDYNGVESVMMEAQIYSGKSFVIDAKISNDLSVFYWATMNGLYKTTSSGETRFLKQACDEVYFKSISFSADKQYLFAEKVMQELSGWTINYKSVISIMDAEGNEIKVVSP